MNKYVITIALVIAVVGIGAYLVLGNQTDTPTIDAPEEGAITIEGELTCLPKRGDGAITLECAIGLLGEDGNYYGLRHHDRFDTGSEVSVSGTLLHEEMKGPDGNFYDIVGIINVTSLE